MRALLPLVVVASLVGGCGGQKTAHVPASAIAVVGGRTITRDAYDAEIARSRRAYAAQHRRFPAAGTTAYAQLRAAAVRLLVERSQLEQEAPGLGVTVDDAQVDARRRLLIDTTFGGDEARYRARLRAQVMTDGDVRSALRAQLLSQRVFAAVTANVKPKTAEARREAFDRWLEGVRTKLVPTYAKGFAPPDSPF